MEETVFNDPIVMISIEDEEMVVSIAEGVSDEIAISILEGALEHLRG
jgi:hypothetical protein